MTTRSCMSLFVLFHQLQKILRSRPWRVALRMSEPGFYVTNDSKTELLIIGSRKELSKFSISSIRVGNCDIKSQDSVRNLGSWFDNHLFMSTHIGKVCSKAFRGLYNIRQIRKYLSEDSTKTLIHAFVT